MTYYTYFKVPKGYRDSRDDNTIQRELSKRKVDLCKDKALLRAAMIDAYYLDDYNKAYNRISYAWNSVIFDMTAIENYETVQMCREDMKEDGKVPYNHADCDSLYSVQDDYDSSKKILDELIGDLLCLSRVHFVVSKYSDEAQTEMNYLRYDYQNEISEIIENAQETIEDISKYQLWIDCWDTKKTEGELYEEEQAAKNNEEDKSQSELDDVEQKLLNKKDNSSVVDKQSIT